MADYPREAGLSALEDSPLEDHCTCFVHTCHLRCESQSCNLRILEHHLSYMRRQSLRCRQCKYLHEKAHDFCKREHPEQLQEMRRISKRFFDCKG